ncbi:nucleoside-diphosphate sugar epimerase/dehydratase [Falsirhodobacter sp. alg1]|uniref:polysaccharide biosynthesis protein n=1 Tax=Falsirhodobacter sp. alg1 TaxID=1472418 RepID=UPI0005F07281|nr:nucleoside-diphosphate sugar epimerase/dehydratase [Falsirhodobacter sp. alg1]
MRSKVFSIVDALSRPQKQAVFLTLDLVLAPLALVLTCILVSNSLFPVALWQQVTPLLPVISVLAGALSMLLGIHRIQLKAFEAKAIIKVAISSVLLGLMMAGLIATSGTLPGVGAVHFSLLFFLLSVAARFGMLRLLQWILRQGKPRHQVLIYGAGTTGVQLAAALRTHDSITPVAFVDDDSNMHGLTISGLRVLRPDQITRSVNQCNIKRVLLAMPSASHARQAQIARMLEKRGLKVMTVPSFAQLVGEEKLVDHLAPVIPGRFLNRTQIESVLPEGAEAYVGRVIVVSGAGGSVGSELCRQLLVARPKRLVLFEASEIALYNVERELREMAEDTDVIITPVLGSVTDARLSRMVMQEHKAEVVFHAAAYKHVPLVEANPIAGLANNVLGTRTFADAANEAGVARFILISTDKAVRPTNIMGASKRLAELVVQDLAQRSRGTVFTMVRFGNVLGSSGSVIPLFRDQISRGGPVTLTHEDVTRFFMTISEAARLVMLAGSFAGNDAGGEVFVLDMGKPVKIRKLAQQMIEAAGYRVRDADTPDGDIEIVVTGLRPGEKLHEELLIGEGLLTTPHPKILRAREACLSELEMATVLRSLRGAVAVGDAEAARDVVHRWVEGYSVPSHQQVRLNA